MDLEIFVACAPGLEPLLHAEIAALGVGALAPAEPGGVTVRGDAASVHRLSLECGLGSHVLVRIATFRARSFSELERNATKIDWKRWLTPGVPRAFRAVARKSRLYHTGAIVERIERWVTEQLGETNVPDELAPVIAARLDRDQCTLSLDVTGPPLHRRGYRLASTKAPLREDLSRALIVASGWDPGTTLADPFCGAGTIPIEAALLARRLAPGRLRSFALERTPLFDPALWSRLRAEADARALDRAPSPIHASDRDEGAARATRENVERAGVTDDLHIACAPLASAPFLEAPPARGALVTDPPHGRRLGDARALRALYQSLGRIARTLPAEWRIAIASSDRRLALATGLELDTALLTDAGGTKLRFLARVPMQRP